MIRFSHYKGALHERSTSEENCGYINLRRQVCRTAQNAQRKGQTDSGRTIGTHRRYRQHRIPLGKSALIPEMRTASVACRNLETQKCQTTLSRKINRHNHKFLVLFLLTVSQDSCNIISVCAVNMRKTTKTGFPRLNPTHSGSAESVFLF